MKKLAAIVIALSMSVSPAYARSDCYGCNIVDIGAFDSSIIGYTLYIDREASPNIPVVVEEIDYANRQALVRAESGERGWISARSLYAYAEVRERDTAATGIAVGAALVALAAIFGGGGSRQSSSSSSTSASSDEPRGGYDPYAGGGSGGTTSAPQPQPREDTSVGCAWGDRAYNTCH